MKKNIKAWISIALSLMVCFSFFTNTYAMTNNTNNIKPKVTVTVTNKTDKSMNKVVPKKSVSVKPKPIVDPKLVSTYKKYRFSTIRYNGKSNVENAILACDDFIKAKVYKDAHMDTVILINTKDNAGAIISSTVSKVYNAPMLFTEGNKLNSLTEAKIKELIAKNGIKKVLMIGNNTLLSPSIESRLKTLKVKVERIGGKDIYETSILVAKKVPNVTEISLICESELATAIAIAPIAARGKSPIIFIREKSVISTGSGITVDDCIELKSYVHELIGNVEDKVPYDKFHLLVYSPRLYSICASFRLLGISCKGISDTNSIYKDNLFNNINFNLSYRLHFQDVCLVSAYNVNDTLAGLAFAAKIGTPFIIIGDDTDLISYKKRYSNFNSLFAPYTATQRVYIFGSKGLIKDGAEVKLYGKY